MRAIQDIIGTVPIARNTRNHSNNDNKISIINIRITVTMMICISNIIHEGLPACASGEQAGDCSSLTSERSL